MGSSDSTTMAEIDVVLEPMSDGIELGFEGSVAPYPDTQSLFVSLYKA